MADLSVTAGNVAWVSGPAPALGVAAETITAGQPIYFDSSVSQWRKAQANVAGKVTPTAIALSGASASGYFFYAVVGCIINTGATIVKNTTYFLSGTNAGGIAPLADITGGWTTTTIFIASTTANAVLTLSNTGITN